VFKKRVAGDARAAERLVALWARLAAQLAPLDPNRILLEPLNEPGKVFSRTDWHTLQGRLVAAIRAAAPRHTIVAAGAGTSTIGDLEALAPYEDDNIVYGFHFYAPMLFTHQGATWSGAPFARLTEVPYPLPLSAVHRLAAAAALDTERQLIVREATEGRDWDGGAIAAAIARAGEWSRRQGKPVVCTEFGAFRDGGVRHADRLRYLHDVRTALEARVSAWTLWDYAGGFGVVRAAARGRTVDQDALAALGLRG
jgi:hypothetical protein